MSGSNVAEEPVVQPRQRRCIRALRRWARVLSVFFGACVAAGYASGSHAYLDLLSAFQVQYLVVMTALAAALFLMRSPCWAVAAGVGAMSAAIQVAPWYWPGPYVDQRATPNLRLALVNVLQENERRDELRDYIESLGLDVVVFLEVDDAWFQALRPLAGRLPYVARVPGTDLRGIAVLSRFELRDRRAMEFGNSAAPSLVCRLELPGASPTLVVTHPWPALNAHGFASRNEQLRQVGDYVATCPRPCLLAGDLNSTMWSQAYAALADRSGLHNARRGFGVLPTFPMDKLMLLRIPLDHWLVSRDVTVVRCYTGQAIGSDHAPLAVELHVPAAERP